MDVVIQQLPVFVQQLINGITLGSSYGLIAIGYTMVFGIIGMVNFAHGDVFMVSAFIALIAFLILTTWIGLSSIVVALFIVLVIAMVFTSLVNWAIERVAYRPLRGSFRLAPLISAIGMSIFLSNFVQVTQGPRNKSIPPLVPGELVLMDTDGYQVTLSYKQMIVWAVTAVLLLAFWYVVAKTPLGRAQRACEQDQKMAALLGIDVDRTVSITFVIAAALAAVAGTMYLMYYGTVNFADGFQPGIKAFTAAVLGGIGSLPGAMLGGVLIGVIEALWSAYFSIDYKDVAAFSVLIIVLIFLPLMAPVAKGLNYDMVWFGCIVAVVLQTAFLSPPVAMSAYYLTQVVTEWNLRLIYRGMAEFMLIQCICVGLVLAFPEIAMWFPNWLDARRKAEREAQRIEQPVPSKAALAEDKPKFVVR